MVGTNFIKIREKLYEIKEEFSSNSSVLNWIPNFQENKIREECWSMYCGNGLIHKVDKMTNA
jgi:hypothetical protein